MYDLDHERRYNDSFNLVIRVENSKIGMIIGKHGSKIKELQEKTGAQIKVYLFDFFFCHVHS